MAKFIFDSLEEVKEFIRELGYEKATAKMNAKAKETKTVVVTTKKAEDVSDAIYTTVPKLAKEYGVCQQAIDWHLKKKNDGLAYTIFDKKRTRYIKVSDAEKYFAEHPFQNTAGIKRSKKVVTPSDFAIWQREIFDKMKKNGLEYNKTSTKIFTTMRNVYGIVWEQVKKDFFEEKRYVPKSTIELCYYLQYVQKHGENEHYENIFENELDKIIEERKKVTV